MDRSSLFGRIASDYAEAVLGWAIAKTGSREEGEDLAQDVFEQLFRSLARNPEIKAVDRYLWKVAHNVWCNRLRGLECARLTVGFAEELLYHSEPDVNSVADRVSLEDELRKMRLHLANLNRRQRDCMTLYYLDGMAL